MSKKAVASKAKLVTGENFRFEFLSIPGVKDPSKIGPQITHTNLPGGERAKSNTISYDALCIRVREHPEIHIVKFLNWLQTASGELASANLYVEDFDGKDAIVVHLNGLEVIQVSSIPLGQGSFENTAVSFEVTMKIGSAKWVVVE